jgi:hypothetical protein
MGLCKPGDTIWISGGSSGLSYNGDCRITKSGTSNAPITFKVSRESGRNGLVTINGIIHCPGQSWITWDGSKDPSYADDVQTTFGLHKITNNINLKIVGNPYCVSYGSGFGPTGLNFRWIEMTSKELLADCHGVRINASSGNDPRNNRFSYLWIHDTGQDGITDVNGRMSWATTVLCWSIQFWRTLGTMDLR